MERNENEALDDILKKMIKGAGLETPSGDFTHTVLHRIQQVKAQNRASIYKPLFSRNTWLFLGLLFSGIMVYIIFWNSPGESLWKSTIPMGSVTDQRLIPRIFLPEIPEALAYSIIALVLLICFQLFVLKRYLDSRLNMS